MSVKCASTSLAFRPRQGLADSLVMRLGGGESKQDVDLERDPFFEFEVWLVPEQSRPPVPLPPEEILAGRLDEAPWRILEFVGRGLLTLQDCVEVFDENGIGIELPDVPPEPCEVRDDAASLLVLFDTSCIG